MVGILPDTLEGHQADEDESAARPAFSEAVIAGSVACTHRPARSLHRTRSFADRSAWRWRGGQLEETGLEKRRLRCVSGAPAPAGADCVAFVAVCCRKFLTAASTQQPYIGVRQLSCRLTRQNRL